MPVRRTIAVLALCLSGGGASAQQLAPLTYLAAMVDGSGGEKLGVATAVGSDVFDALYVTHRDVGAAPGACLRPTPTSACLPIAKGPIEIAGAPSLVAVTVSWRDQAEMAARRAAAPPVDGSGLFAVGRSRLADWRVHARPLAQSAASGAGLLVRSDGLTPLDLGAPVGDDRQGVVGFLAAFDAGEALIVDSAPVIAALATMGFTVDLAWIRSDPGGDADLGAVAQVISVVDLGGYQVFAAPRALEAWGTAPPVDVHVEIRDIRGLGRGDGAGDVLFAQTQRFILNSDGFAVSTAFARTREPVAVCVEHELPGAPPARGYALSFWKPNPARIEGPYEQAAREVVGRSTGPQACAEALAGLDASRLRELAGVAPGDWPPPPVAVDAEAAWTATASPDGGVSIDGAARGLAFVAACTGGLEFRSLGVAGQALGPFLDPPYDAAMLRFAAGGAVHEEPVAKDRDVGFMPTDFRVFSDAGARRAQFERIGAVLRGFLESGRLEVTIQPSADLAPALIASFASAGAKDTIAGLLACEPPHGPARVPDRAADDIAASTVGADVLPATELSATTTLRALSSGDAPSLHVTCAESREALLFWENAQVEAARVDIEGAPTVATIGAPWRRWRYATLDTAQVRALVAGGALTATVEGQSFRFRFGNPEIRRMVLDRCLN